MKSTVKIVAALAVILALASCGTPPTACISVVTPADSIHVGKPVQFDGTCSADEKSYRWDFGNGEISTSGQPTMTFDSARDYEIFLLVTNDRKTANTSKTITVKP